MMNSTFELVKIFVVHNCMAGQHLYVVHPEDTGHMGLTSEAQAVIY